MRRLSADLIDVCANGADLTGSYTCAYGTMNCLGLNNTGTIAYGRIEGSYMPDSENRVS